MKARELINNATLVPDALKVVGQAFDEAWASIVSSFGDNPLVVQAPRLKLANAILSEVQTNSYNDVEALKKVGLRAMTAL